VQTISDNIRRSQALARIRRFFRTPKGLLLLILVLLTAVAARQTGFALIAPILASAVIVSAVIDLPIIRARQRTWEFPSGAVLTGLIIAMVLSPQEPWYVAAAAAAVGIAAKYVVRTRSANVFNPAALGLVVTFFPFHTGQSWWGALAEFTPQVLGMALLVVTGLFITERVNKIPLALAFLGTFYLLFTLTAFLGDPRRVAEVFRTPDLQAVLYFTFFILTDPPTSPVRHPDQILCGVLVGVTSYVFYEAVGAVYYLLAGVLVGNVWEAWRRITSARERAAAALAAI
jgi:Na+-translocating ferredoxin:NAD+ oxidoreductase RnfD subunit